MLGRPFGKEKEANLLGVLGCPQLRHLGSAGQRPAGGPAHARRVVHWAGQEEREMILTLMCSFSLYPIRYYINYVYVRVLFYVLPTRITFLKEVSMFLQMSLKKPAMTARIMPSFLRFGSLQLAAKRQELNEVRMK